MVEKNKLQFAEIARRFSSKCQASIPSFYGIAWRSSSEVGPHYFGLCSKARFSFVFILQPGNSSVEEFHHGAGKFFPGAVVQFLCAGVEFPGAVVEFLGTR